MLSLSNQHCRELAWFLSSFISPHYVLTYTTFAIDNISPEKLSVIDGDILFFLVGKEDQNDQKLLEEFKEKPLWRNLRAVKENKVYFVDEEYWHNIDILSINAVLDDLEKYLVNAP